MRYNISENCEHCKHCLRTSETKGICRLKDKIVQWYDKCRKYDKRHYQPMSM